MAATPKIVSIPESALVVLVGVAGSGKSTFARERFRATEILSSDFFRAMVSDDEGNQDASLDAFALLRSALEKRLRRGKLSVVDATNVRTEHRAPLLACAALFNRPAVAIVFDTPVTLCVERASSRRARVVDATVIQKQWKELAQNANLLSEGFSTIFRISVTDEVEIHRPDASF